MSKLSKILIAFILNFFIGIVSTYAQTTFHKEIPDIPATPALVNDFGKMLRADEVLLLENKLLQFEKESSNEVVIVTVESLGGNEIASFAVELGRKWDIGKESKKNGVLILASKTDRKVNISPAYGLSGVLPDVICSRIIREQIVPNFKKGNMYQGFDEAVDKIIAYSKGEFTADEEPTGSGIPMLLVLLFFMLLIFIFFFAIRNKTGSTYVSRRGYKSSDSDWGSGGGFFGGGSWGGGGSDSGDSGGGFGGFGGGGGGFDGGGSSGSW
ncbi:MAG: TPM domain-containing protein [Bacteroidetes bacterium]|nr:TPM domain-containing protein [Bacteroidota bacterium]MBP6315185.1 TPM domain-containing protein [Chitinophagaceae bacterium]